MIHIFIHVHIYIYSKYRYSMHAIVCIYAVYMYHARRGCITLKLSSLISTRVPSSQCAIGDSEIDWNLTGSIRAITAQIGKVPGTKGRYGLAQLINTCQDCQDAKGPKRSQSTNVCPAKLLAGADFKPSPHGRGDWPRRVRVGLHT